MTLGLGALAWQACLPGLIPELPDAGVDAGPMCGGFPCCGDGVIEVDAGETCDLGSGNMSPFCQGCRVVCAAPDGGSGRIDDSVSNHCYFEFGSDKTATEGDASATCTRLGAHIVTFADPAEVDFVVQDLDRGAPRYWVGLTRRGPGDGGTYASAAATEDEPGWAAATACLGCYSPGIVRQRTLPEVDGGSEAGPPSCVVASSNATAAAEAIGCAAQAKVICEQEPVGHRSQPCGSGVCFDLVATRGSKHYFLSTEKKPAPAAASYCNHTFRDDGGPNGTLVIFESGAEREQLIWELLQSPGGPPSQFWIGLSSLADDAGVDGGPAIAWFWDDFSPAGTTPASSPPPVWGAAQPQRTAGAGLHAYIQISPRYDTGLAYAEESMRNVSLPFVCQWTP